LFPAKPGQKRRFGVSDEIERMREMRRKKENIGFVLIVRMGTPFLFPSISALSVEKPFINILGG